MGKAKKSTGKKILKALLAVLLALILIVLGYAVYLQISYYRIGDKQLETENDTAAVMETGVSYRLASWNIGFGAYTKDFGFFMDGGKESRAVSSEKLEENMKRITEKAVSLNADLFAFQEVDCDSDRSWHRDERKDLASALSGMGSVFAMNYDSPYLFWPPLCPHGASRSGLYLFSRFGMSDSRRVELPVEDGITKMLDLDRCYLKTRMQVADGSELVMYDLHLSAYTTDGIISDEQLNILLDDMSSEQEKGNRCIACGDFNKDLLGNSDEVFGCVNNDYAWAKPLPEGMIENHGFTLVCPDSTFPSCRNADSAYHDGQFLVTVDGFITGKGVRVESAEVAVKDADEMFLWSDHNPVVLTFTLE